MNIKSLIPFRRKNISIRREDYDPFSSLRQAMNSLFDDFDRRLWLEPFDRTFEGFSPRVDVSETDKEIIITAELPGLDDKDIDVSLNKEVLTIRGDKREEKEDKGKDYYCAERSYGSFTRTIPLPAEIDTDKVKAEFKKGVLTVTMPKTEEAMKDTKKIPIKTD